MRILFAAMLLTTALLITLRGIGLDWVVTAGVSVIAFPATFGVLNWLETRHYR